MPRSNLHQLCAIVLGMGLSMATGVHGAPFTDPYEITTIHGTFRIPRTFAPIEVWKYARIDPHETNYFVMRMTAEYVAERVSGFAPLLNHVAQDVIIAVEALTAKRSQMLANVQSSHCSVATHDLEPLSKPYKRCEYRLIFDDQIAVKIWLNGSNINKLDEVEALVHQTIKDWLQP